MYVNAILVDEITKLDHTLIPQRCEQTYSVKCIREWLTPIIDRLGRHSASAQGLSRVLTTAEKMHASTKTFIYLLKDSAANDGKGDVCGMLKIGWKNLYLADSSGKTHEVEPLCVLDFYVETAYQHKGNGKKLFDFMLQDMKIPARHLAIDGPSKMMQKFLENTYGLTGMILHANNFAVAPTFFDDISVIRESARSTAVLPTPPAGRFTAPFRRCEIATVIHGSGSPAESSCSRQSDVDATKSPIVEDAPQVEEEAVAVEVVQTEKDFVEQSAPVEEVQAAPERPSTLHVETPATPDLAAPSPAGSVLSRRDSQLTDKGFFDVKFYHNKLW